MKLLILKKREKNTCSKPKEGEKLRALQQGNFYADGVCVNEGQTHGLSYSRYISMLTALHGK